MTFARNEINEKTTVRISVAMFWSMVVSCCVGTAVAAATYVHILERLDRIEFGGVTHGEFQSWCDSLRSQNENLPLRVPSVPQHGKSYDYAVAETRVTTKKN